MSNGLMSLPLAEAGGSFWFPPQASEFAPGVDFTYDFILWLCIVFFVGICGFTAYFAVKYRKRPGHKEEITSTHNTRLEMAWSIIPLFFLMAIFGISTYWYLQIVTPPTEEVREIEVTAKRWNWTFKYKGEPFASNEQFQMVGKLHVVKGQAYQLVMTTPDNDVLHSLFIPAFRVKQDCVPGRYNKLWFRPTMTHMEAGATDGFALYCTEYCGDDHSKMLGRVYVHETVEEWAAAVRRDGDLRNIEDLVERGKYIYETQCVSCHSIDGSEIANGGPSWKGLWGKEETVLLPDGTETTVKVDQGYVRESVITPGAKVVKGYGNVMTPFDWGAQNDIALDGIYAYLESLKD